jgi:hypothetical protein
VKHQLLCGLSVSLLASTFGIALQAAPQTAAVPKTKPSFNEVYEFCLVGYAETGAGRNKELQWVGSTCQTAAEVSSGGPQPPLSTFSSAYEDCLLVYAVQGADPRADLAKVCSINATAMTGEQPPDKRYVFFQQAPNPNARPSYADAYESCLVMFAESGFGRQAGMEDIVRSCNETAAQQSGTPKPETTPYVEIYERCLLSYAQFGAPKGLDLGKACTEVATGVTSTPPPVTTRQPR